MTLPIPCPLSNSRYELALSCDWFGSPAESPKRPCYLTSQAGRRRRLNANAAAIREIASAVSQSPEWSKDAQNIAVDLWTRDKSNILTPWGLDTHHRSALHLCEHVALEAQAAGFEIQDPARAKARCSAPMPGWFPYVSLPPRCQSRALRM